MTLRAVALLVVSFLSIAPISDAQLVTGFASGLDAPVSAGSAVTVRTLLAKVFKGVGDDAESGGIVTASEVVLRQLGVKDRTVLSGGARIADVETLRVRGDGKRYVVLLVGVESDETYVPGGGAAVLAVFPEGSSEPQDVAEVKEDVFCSFGEPATLALGPDDGFLVTNSHSNSSQGYLITALYQVRGGRIRRIDSIFTLRSRGSCASSFEQELAWTTVAEKGSPYPKIVATVTMAPPTEDDVECQEGEKPVKREVFTGSWRFDREKNRYVPAGGNLDRLQKLNMENL
jgi:hypothetical protein